MSSFSKSKAVEDAKTVSKLAPDETTKKEAAKVVSIAEESKKATGLQKELENMGIDYTTFSLTDEYQRKRLLKEDYAKLKEKHGWLYDQPISGE